MPERSEKHGKCRSVGIRSIALFALFLFFGMRVSVSDEAENILRDIDSGSTIGKCLAVPRFGFGVVSDQGIPELLKSCSVPSEEYARLIFETGINDNIILAVKNLESVGFLVESAANTKQNGTELILRVPSGLNGPNEQSGINSKQGTYECRNNVSGRILHEDKFDIGIPVGIALGVILAFCSWGLFVWIDARCFDLLQYWQTRK